MSAYPGDWSLLGASEDPWPGDVRAVSAAVTYYQSLADDIRSQAASLRQLAEEVGDQTGKFAPELRGSSEDLAGVLERAESRFDTVAAQLKVWEPELAHGQQSSRAMLREAEAHAAARDANAPPSTPVDPKDDAAVTADQARDRRHGQAVDDLNAVVTRFRTLHGEVEHVASQVAGKIKDASHDSLKNHRFDGLRQWMHDHADLLKTIADVLTFIATAIVIAVVVFGTGGLALAALATVGALLIHSALAAQGDGSWVDVAIDAFSLLTMGTGKVLTTGAKGLLAAREGAAAYQGTTTAARVAFQESTGLSKAVVFVTRSNPVVRSITGLKAGLAAFSSTFHAEYEGGLLARLVFGDKDAAGVAKAIAAASRRLGSGSLLDAASGLMNLQANVFRASVAVDATFKVLNDANFGAFTLPGVSSWVTWKEEHTVHALNAP